MHLPAADRARFVRTFVRRAMLGFLSLASGLSCGREVTSPGGGMSAPLAVVPSLRAGVDPAALRSGIPVTAVRLVLRRSDNSVALERAVAFPAADTSISLTLSVPLSEDATRAGEPFFLTLAFVTAAGDTVFRGGPVTVLATPGGASAPPQPVTVPISYTGAGAQATRVVISPDTVNVLDGGAFAFTAQAFDAQGVVVANAPVLFYTPDSTRLTVGTNGAGTALALRGAARVVATLLNPGADTATVLVALRASAIAVQGGNNQTAITGALLPQPVAVRVTAADGVPVAGVSVGFAANNGGLAGAANVVTDANGVAATTWRLGALVGAQTLTATAAGLTGSPVTFSATALVGAPTQLAVVQQPTGTNAVSALGTVIVEARDAGGALATGFTGPVTIALANNPGGATLGGVTTQNAVAGVATFPGLVVNRPGTGYTLTVTSGALTAATTSGFSIVAGPATALAFSVQPPALAGVLNVLAPAVVVAGVDAAGNVAPSFTGTVSMALANNPGGATLGGATTSVPALGLATFAALTLDQIGVGYTLTATATGLTAATSAAFTVGASVNAWTNVAGGTWSTAANWSLGRVPVASDSVVIAAAGTYTVTLDTDFSGAYVTVGGAGSAPTLSGVARTLTTTGGLTSAAGATVVMRSSVVNGPVRLAGTLTLEGTTTVNGAVTTSSTATLRVQGSGTAGNTLATLVGGFTNTGAIELTHGGGGSGQSASLEVTGGPLVNEATGTISAVVGAGGGGRALVAALDNRGLVTVAAPLTLGRSGATHFNTGTIDLTTADLVLAFSGAGSGFTNSGTTSVPAGRTLTVSGPGVLTHAGGATLGGAGTLVSTGGTTIVLNASHAFGLLDATGATITLGAGITSGFTNGNLVTGTLNGTGNVSVAAGATLFVRSSAISVPVAVAGTLVLEGSTTLGAALTTTSTATVRAQGSGAAGNSTVTIANGFTNNGLLELSHGGGGSGQGITLSVTTGTLTNAATGTIASVAGSGGGPRTLDVTLANLGGLTVNQPLTLARAGAAHTSSGTMTVGGGDLTITFSGAGSTFSHTGTTTVATTRTLTIGGPGTFTHAATATLSGAGTLAGSTGATLALNGPVAVGAVNANAATVTLGAGVALPLGNGSLINATLNGAGSASMLAGQTVLARTSTVAVPLAVSGILVLEGATTLSGAVTTTTTAVLRPQATGATGTSTVTIANGFTNNGLIELTHGGGGSGQGISLAIPAGTLTNASSGTISALPGSGGGVRTLDAAVANQGAITLSTALFIGRSNAVHSNAAAGTISLTGGDLTVVFSGTGSSFVNNGSISVPAGRTLTVNGPGTFTHGTGGTMSGAGTVNATSSSTLALNVAPAIATISASFATVNIGTGVTAALGSGTFISSTLNGPGTASIASTAQFLARASTLAAPLSVSGTLNLEGTTTISGSLGTASTATVRARGDGAGGNALVTVTNGFANNGVLELTHSGVGGSGQSATLNVGSGELLNNGTIRVNAGGGGGTRTLGANVGNSGVLSIYEGSAGTLQLNGNLTGSGTIRLSIGGLTAGTLFGRLNVSGFVFLSGTMDVTLWNGFTPSAGQQFTVLTSTLGLSGGLTNLLSPPSISPNPLLLTTTFTLVGQ